MSDTTERLKDDLRRMEGDYNSLVHYVLATASLLEDLVEEAYGHDVVIHICGEPIQVGNFFKLQAKHLRWAVETTAKGKPQ